MDHGICIKVTSTLLHNEEMGGVRISMDSLIFHLYWFSYWWGWFDYEEISTLISFKMDLG